ncbi:MAG: M24 family metallopeptidase [Promethearchaeota archaeon]
MRLDRGQRIMKREEINGIILFDKPNIRYLTGYKPLMTCGESAAVIGQDGEPCLIVPEGEFSLAKARSWISNVRPYGIKNGTGKLPTLANLIKETIENLSLSSSLIGIELNFVSARRFEELKRQFPDAGFKDVSMTIAELRMIKDEAEIERLTTAIQIAEHGVRTAIEIIQPGITEVEVATEVERTLRKAGANQTGYPTVIASDPRAGCSYAPASQREIGADEFIVIALSAVFDDYCSNITRTVMTGKPNEAKRKLFECARDGLQATRSKLIPGIQARDIAQTIYNVAKEREFESYSPDTMGNSIGLQPIEPPIFSINSEAPILPGMVFCIESNLFHPELGGIRLCDTIVHQKDGSYKVLNQVPLDTV